MCKTNEFELNIQERLATIRFICNNSSHLSVDDAKCKICKTRECLTACPADVYTEGVNNSIDVDFENCLECGTCRIVCPFDAIHWEYPKDASGVTYKFG